MSTRLPTFSSGLKIIRIGVFAMLLQLVVSLITTVKLLGADSLDDVYNAFEWTQYLMMLHVGAMLAMLVGVVRAIPELARVRIYMGSLVIAALGFLFAAAALGWTYLKLSGFLEVAMDPEASAAAVGAMAGDLENMKYLAIVKDLAYAFALISVARTIERSAAANDQIGLRYEAQGMTRALVVMLVGDLFYQLTYGAGGGVGLLGLVGSLLVAGYWIYCHVRLQRFLYNAAYFVNEPHNLPLATAVRVPEKTATAPAKPRAVATPPPVNAAPIEIAKPAPAPAPRAPSAEGDGDSAQPGPQFLR